jgi:hypothetical protein
LCSNAFSDHLDKARDTTRRRSQDGCALPLE